jgi:hypothetical protein
MIGTDGEDGLDHGLLTVVAHPGGGASSSCQEIDSLKNNGFTGTGFTGQDDQPGFLSRKIEMKRIDQGQIMYSKFLQHSSFYRLGTNRERRHSP